MKPEDLLDGIGTVEEDLLERSEGDAGGLSGERKSVEKKGFRRLIVPVTAAAAVVLAVAGGILLVKSGILRKKNGNILNPFSDSVLKKYTIAAAVYPKLSAYPDPADYDMEKDNGEQYINDLNAWIEESAARRNKLIDYGVDKATEPVAVFSASGMMNILSDRNGENRAFSPINIYLTLAMLAEITDGNTRQQILTLVGADSVADIRTRADALWNAIYKNDASGKCVLGSSIWLRDDTDSYKKKALEDLAVYYHASSFRGKMGTEEYNKALRTWLNNQTGGLLENEAGNVSLDGSTMLALVTTILYQAKWSDEFVPSLTDTGVFHADKGDLTVSYMHRTEGSSMYYCGDKFLAVPKHFTNKSSAYMWFILPDEGVTVDELLSDPQVHRLLEKGAEGKGHSAIVDLTVPKYDLTSSIDLCGALKKMGLSDVFDAAKSDFTPLFKEGNGYYVSEAQHAVRVKVDEEGVKAAAFTEAQIAGMALLEDRIEFTLDRPFLFSIQTYDNIPLFVGVVEQP